MPGRRRRSWWIGLSAALALGACGDEGTSADDDECKRNTNTPGNRCVDPIRFDFDPKDVTIDEDLQKLGVDFSVPADGFQITTQGVRLGPWQDDEWCEAFEVPADPKDPEREYCITRVEVAMTFGYHHLFVAKAPEGSPSDKLMKVGERVRCVGGAHVTYGTDLLPIPLPQGSYVDVPYPVGIGEKLRPGQKVSVNYHYFNAADTDTIAVTKLNFHAAPCDGLQEMGQFGFYNQDIEIPPGSTYSTEMSATFTQDVYVLDLFRHTHRYGGDVPVYFYKGARDGELIYTSSDYELDAGYRFEEPVLIRKGEGFRFICNFHNWEDHPVRFGPTADDEMCMLLGTFWTADPKAPLMTQHRYKWQ